MQVIFFSNVYILLLFYYLFNKKNKEYAGQIYNENSDRGLEICSELILIWMHPRLPWPQ